MTNPCDGMDLGFDFSQSVTKMKLQFQTFLVREDADDNDGMFSRQNKMEETQRTLANMSKFNDQLYTRFEGGKTTEYTGKQKKNNKAAAPTRADKAVKRPDGTDGQPTNLYHLMQASVIWKFGMLTAGRGDEMRQIDMAHFTDCNKPHEYFPAGQHQRVLSFPIPTSKQDHSTTLQFVTVGNTEDPTEDPLFEYALSWMYQYEHLGLAAIGDLKDTLLPLLPGSFNKATNTFNRMTHEGMHASLATFLKYVQATGAPTALQETITVSLPPYCDNIVYVVVLFFGLGFII